MNLVWAWLYNSLFILSIHIRLETKWICCFVFLGLSKTMAKFRSRLYQKPWLTLDHDFQIKFFFVNLCFTRVEKQNLRDFFRFFRSVGRNVQLDFQLTGTFSFFLDFFFCFIRLEIGNEILKSHGTWIFVLCNISK